MKYNEVSVLVLSYNSSGTVIETLDSIKNQTYKNLHIFVSDDCSTDDSYAIIEKWISENKSRFLTSTVLKTESNLGVSCHMDQCVRLLPTVWFKGLAADDILLPDCIEKYMNYINRNDCRGMVYAKHLNFYDNHYGRHYNFDYEEQMYQKRFGEMTAEQQRLAIAKREVLCSPTCFTNRNDVIEAGGYDLSIKNIEDWPIKMRLLDCGFKMNRMDEYTVLYRMGNSISRSNERFFKPEFIDMEKKVKKLYCYPTAKRSLIYRWNNRVTYLRYYLIINVLGNKRNGFTNIVNISAAMFNTVKLRKAVLNTLNKKRTRQETDTIISGFSKIKGL